jgi:hypothetical protein
MFESVKKWSVFRVFLVIALLLSTVFVAGFAAYALQTVSIPLEVKEPLEILDYPSGFSLYPGENVTFEITVQNLASMAYFVEFDFRLNDTEYQARYVTFSNHNYSIMPGTQKLTAWLTIASTAPAANLILTIDRETDTPSPSPTPSPTPSNQSELDLSVKLLGAGARWAAGNGTKALYINNKDNWEAHHLTDGADWGRPWFTEELMDHWRTEISTTLEQRGFEVTFKGDVPENLSGYDLVVFEALWAVEPKHVPLVREYLANGGGVVVLDGVPTQFSVYCKDRWPYLLGGTNLASLKDWLGAASFVNTGGYANVVYENPFGTQISTSDLLFLTEGESASAVTGLDNDAKVVARWSSGATFAFTHEFGEGRVYYQAHW